MAVMRILTCSVCGKEKNIIVSSSNDSQRVCDSCLAIEGGTDRQRHLDMLCTLELEKRIRLLEEWVYDYKPLGLGIF